MSDVLTTIASTLARQGAPVLGGLIGTAIGSPALGGLAGKALEVVADALGTAAEPDAVADALAKPGAEAAVARAEAGAGEMIRIWEIEARRISDAQAAELASGFSSWQFWKGVIQAVVWAGWSAILVCALIGGNLGVKPLLPMGEMVGTWGSVTMAWLVVYNGGHTIKDLASNGVFKWRGK